MRKLINSMPEKAKNVFNRCLTISADDHQYSLNEAPRKAFESENLEIQLCFDFLDDDYNIAKWVKVGIKEKTDDVNTVDLESLQMDKPKVIDQNSILSEFVETPYVDDSKVLKENHPLNHLIVNSRQELLTHPLVLSLYRSKWTKAGVYSYYSNLVLYLVFMLILNSYALMQPPPYSYDHSRYSLFFLNRYKIYDVQL